MSQEKDHISKTEELVYEEENLTASDQPVECTSVLKKLVARGSYANLYKSELDDERLESKKMTVVIKVPHESGQDARIQREAEILTKCCHSNICYSIGTAMVEFEDYARDCIILFYYEHNCTIGLLFERIAKTRVGKLKRDEALMIIKQICGAVGYIHEQGILHRAIEPSNILVDCLGRVVLIGFSNSILLDEGNEVDEQCGQFPYQAPEVIAGEAYGFPVDIYCCGLICYQLLHMELPSEEQQAREGNVLDEYIDCFLSSNPKTRPTAQACRYHPTIAQGDLSFADVPEYGRLVKPPNETDLDRYFWMSPEFDFDFELLLGHGSFSNVYVARGPNKQRLAAKVICVSDFDENTYLNIQEEYECHQLLDHQSICKIHKRIDFTYESKNFTCFLLDLVRGIELDKLCTCLHRKGSWLLIREIHLIAAQVLDALKYLGTNKVVHRDIKCDNIMIDEFGCVTMIDFTFASRCNSKGYVEGGQGTQGFAAPETYLQEWGCNKSDVFSAGVIFYYLVYRIYPFSFDAITYASELNESSLSYPPVDLALASMVQMISEMLIYDPKKRASAKRLCRTDFIRLVNLESIRKRESVQEYSRAVPIFERLPYKFAYHS